MASILLVVRNLAENRFPGAVARGSIPEEAIAFVILDAEQHLLDLSMHLYRDRTGMPSALASLPADQIASIEVIKGRAVGIENLGVIVATVKPGAMLRRRVAPTSPEEIRVVPEATERPVDGYVPAVLLRRPRTVVPEATERRLDGYVPAVLLRTPRTVEREVPVELRKRPAPR